MAESVLIHMRSNFLRFTFLLVCECFIMTFLKMNYHLNFKKLSYNIEWSHQQKNGDAITHFCTLEDERNQN